MPKPKSNKRTQPAIGGDSRTKKSGTFKVSPQPVAQTSLPGDVHKFEATRDQSRPRPDFEDLGELPTGYGESTLFLIARDPRWLFAYWDVDWTQFPASKMRAGERRIFLKIFSNSRDEESSFEINPEAQNWYIPVSRSKTVYAAEMGYYGKTGKWKTITRSNDAMTPSDELSSEAEAVFATVPLHLTFDRLAAMVKSSGSEGDLASALARLQQDGRRLSMDSNSTPQWTEEQKRLLATLVGVNSEQQMNMGSGALDQLLRAALHEKLQSESASEISLKGRLESAFGPMESSLFSGIGASWSAQPFSVVSPREFFMHVNAEVIFYGGTHPDATVWVNGEKIQLDPAGRFRYHFRFPDGNYEIPIIAESPDKVEKRSATLSFQRTTSRRGDVGHTEQPAHLDAPKGGRRG